MLGKYKTIIIFLAIVLVIGGAAFAYPKLSDMYSQNAQSQETSSDQSSRIQAPDFKVYNYDGKEVMLSDYFGKPIVLNFWASWCPPCKAEMPTFNAVYQDIKDDVQFLMVDLVDGQKETEAKGKAYIEEQGFTFPVLFDNDGSAGYMYQISSIPTTFFLDKDGYIASYHTGMMDAIQLQSGINGITD
ncbi:MAG: TlpA disulfide reductase family protein [Eubacteriales bacterium]|jgi:thiol-disulfide isomerase/thioredoxin|nr:TlpA disulfide reductase family protein [Eubacteriales bacterium]MDD4327381.1 TlpA disulfide reductase family protein [Eubacteriales bacterium]MDD4717126.1 TlpA disulfide reductase family protein [Eubacteriales bacterium]NCU25991.1 TlpA family protein disulfide reductase [Candidatus Nomurabacteria bacterium]